MVRKITQREFRNSSAAVMDAVENGETIVITRNGTPVAEVRPVRRRQFAATAEVVQAVHGLGRPNFAAVRAEADELFGEDRVDD